MTPEEWHRVKEVLQTALELDPGARAGFLDSACPSENSLRSEVESLLRSHDQDRVSLEQPIAIDPANLLVSTSPATWIGRCLGPYKLLEQVGEGGMGAVYRAVRADGSYDKQVAIKLIRSGLGTDFFVARFRNERQILAALEHPNIARLLDGGVTEEGLPYVVLEFVTGMPIDEYCARHDLPIADRLKLFRTVCSAVQYAHQNLVVHRDLKPGNILVTEDGVPKLLDFGIAKILDPEKEDGGDHTLTMMRVMTPDFASPEQVRGDPITTASDVYSLGVILYLLLAGRRPYRVSGAAPHEIIKAICDTDPEKPSTAVTRSEKREKTAQPDAQARAGEGTEQDSKGDRLRRALSGDLDNIVLKALRKERERRYATIEQFSEDIRRHLEHLPVIARKDTPAYRASKFVLRHKVGVGATVVFAFALIAAFSITVREERIAQRRFNDVRSLANSLIFDIHDSIKDLPGSTPARKVIVDRALRYLNALAQESSRDLGLQRELATAYARVGLVQGNYRQDNLGDVKGSLDSYQRALEIRKQVDAKSRDWLDRLALAEAYRLVAEQQWPTGKEHEARDNMDRAIAISEALNKAHPNDPKVLYELSFDHESSQLIGYPNDPEGDLKGRADIRRALEVDEALLKIQPDGLRELYGYAVDLSRMGGSLGGTDPNGALTYYQRELEISQKLTQRSSELRYAREVAHAYSEIGGVYDDFGDYPGAVVNNEKALAIFQGLSQSDPKNAYVRQSLAISYINTAVAVAKAGDFGLALEDSNKGQEIMRSLASAAPENKSLQHSFAAVVVAGGTVFMRSHHPEAALGKFQEARAIYKSLFDAGFDSAFHGACTAECSEKMGEASALAGNAQGAADYFHQALTIAERLISANSGDVNALYVAADAYSGLGDLSFKKAGQPGQTASLRKANWTEARSWYAKSLAAWHRIEHPNRSAMNGFDVGDPAQVARNLHQCEATLARFGAPLQ